MHLKKQEGLEKKQKGPTKFTEEDRITFYRVLEDKLAQQEFS